MSRTTMPYKKSTKTRTIPNLRWSCFRVIAKNIKQLLKDIEKLPDVLINELYQKGEIFKLKLHPLPSAIFLNSANRKLTFNSHFNEFDSPNVLLFSKITTVCKNLTWFCLSGCEQISPLYLEELTRGLPQIRRLELTHPSCTNSVLKTISSHCLQLRHLNIYNCPQVTDSGIHALCIGNKSKITHLNISKTNVTEKGYVIALKNLLFLKEFILRYNQIISLFQLLTEELSLNNSSSTWVAKHLEILSDNVFTRASSISSEEMLKCSTIFFPNLTRIQIRNVSHGLLHLVEFKRLFKIEINDSLNFTEFIAPVLEKINKNLIKLVLTHVYDINVKVIGHFCTMLKFLHFHSVNTITTSGNITDCYYKYSLFRNLKQLEIISSVMSEQQLSMLLIHSKRLIKFDIQHNQTLTDELIMDMIKYNKLKLLKSIYLLDCNSVSHQTLIYLLQLNNPMNSLHVYKCANIRKNEYQYLKNFVQKCNLDVLITHIE